MHDPLPKRIAIAVVQRRTDDGQVEFLVGRRSRDQALAGFDEFPGGLIEPDESPSQAAVRECREETGLAVHALEPLPTVDHQYEFGSLQLHFFRCEVDESADGDSVQSPFRWLSPQQVADCRFPPANDAVVARLLGS